MKKYILSFFLIIIFGIYIFYQKIGGNTAPAVILNTSVIASGGNSIPATIKKPAPKPVKNPPVQTPPASVATPVPTPTPPAPAPVLSMYKDGTFTGDVADAYYGNIQVSATINNGKLTDVAFLQYPNDRRTSIEINTQAMPLLKSEAIQAQNANVDGVSGATETSRAFVQSLASALNLAKN